MEQIVECIVVGGPQHGMVCQRRIDARRPAPLALETSDGVRCVPAARRHSRTRGTRIILLHPQATGAQFLTMLAA